MDTAIDTSINQMLNCVESELDGFQEGLQEHFSPEDWEPFASDWNTFARIYMLMLVEKRQVFTTSQEEKFMSLASRMQKLKNEIIHAGFLYPEAIDKELQAENPFTE